MANCIAFHSYKGGTGKTTIGANFAALLAKKGYRVFLLDLDVYAPSLQTYFNEKKPKKWINDFLFGNAEVDDILVDLTPTLDNYGNSNFSSSSSSSSKDKPNGRLMAGFSNSKREEIYKLESGGKQENSKMQLLRKFILLREQLLSSHDADYIIIDTSPGIRYWSINALAVADILFLTLKMDELDIEGTKTIAQEIYSSFTRHGTKSYLLLNRVAGYCTPHGMSLKNESMEEAAASRNSVTNIQNVGSSTIQMPKEQEQSDIINMLSKELKMDVISSIPCYCDIQFNKREYLTVLEYPHHPFAEKINSLIENLKAAKS
ncbi:MAG TPA: AAA family ATPase [Nitrososphaeraceae archaeon]|nr:AAA family ATPase [Nitrososphaeraceae archaeon]